MNISAEKVFWETETEAFSGFSERHLCYVLYFYDGLGSDLVRTTRRGGLVAKASAYVGSILDVGWVGCFVSGIIWTSPN